LKKVRKIGSRGKAAAAASATARPASAAAAGAAAAAAARHEHNAKQDKARYTVEASAEQIAEAPVGNLGHRIWKCLAGGMAELRDKRAAPEDLATSTQCNIDGDPAWERALQPRPSKPMKKVASEASFRWVVEPEGGFIEGTAYSDGSLRDGPIVEL